MNLIKVLIVLTFFMSTAQAQMAAIKYGGGHTNQNEENISFGPVYVAQYRMDLDFNDFKIQNKSSLKIEAKLQNDSLQWIRGYNNVLLPRAIMNIKIQGSKEIITLKYNGTNVALTNNQDTQTSDLYVGLLSNEKVEIYRAGKKIGHLQLNVTPNKENTSKSVRDYSCYRYGVIVEGLENEYVSIGCNFTSVGGLHYNTGHLQVGVTASNIKMADGSKAPFYAQLASSGTVETEVIDKNGKKRTIKVTARVPKRAPKLGMAWGAGPYSLQARDEDVENDTVIAPALFLYGKYSLEGGASIKFFDAFVYNKAFFNNFGLYFSYLLADAQDGRLQILPLLGAQTLNFQLTGDSRKLRKVIFPQGFEFLLKHGLGIEGNTMALGLFIFPSDTESYYNTWFRFGKGMFWEINYIGYKGEGRRVSTWGLSFGLPLAFMF